MRDDLYLPPDYLFLDEATAGARIREHLRKQGAALGLWAHLYQRAALVDLATFHGDGVALAARAARRPWPKRVVCASVRFVAENARLLMPPESGVWWVDPEAGCPMSDPIARARLETAIDAIRARRPYDRLLPLVSVTSSLEVKALAGELGGATVGSSNAARLLAWGLGIAERVLWSPDPSLLANVAAKAGLTPDQILAWREDEPPSEAALEHARVICIANPCAILAQFRVADVAAARAASPGATVLVQQDLPGEVVAAADGAGPLATLAELAAARPRHSTVVLGSEIHAVENLAAEIPDRTFKPLATTFCGSMYSITLGGTLHVLDHLDDCAAAPPMAIDERLAEPARSALARMLDIGESA
ncbi:MAG: quinolinate synthase NadA [Deltaproteobacteria bacterium]|nr:quinolinate synthase NadA [Deltaproteobacteria bacterium]